MGARGTAFASDFDGTLCESDWETRTKVSDKYREVTVDQILRRFMAL